MPRPILAAVLAIAMLSGGVSAIAEGQSDPAATPAVTQQGDPNEKVLVVLIFDQTCHAWCGKVRPIMAQLKKDCGESAIFEEIDATRSVLKQAKEKAKELGIAGYLPDAIDQIPLVLVFARHHKFIGQLSGPKNKEDYDAMVTKAMHKS